MLISDSLVKLVCKKYKNIFWVCFVFIIKSVGSDCLVF